MDLFAQAVHRRDSLSVKWNRKAIKSICGNPDAQPFWVADMDYPAPPVVLEALQEQIHHGVLGYPTFSDHVSVFTAWAAKRHNWTMEKANVVIAPGMLASVATLIELLSRPGDAVILPMPAYQPFVHIIQDLNRKLIPWPMAYDQDTHHFSLDVSSLEQLAHQHHSPLLVFCSPHNPTDGFFPLKNSLQSQKWQRIATLPLSAMKFTPTLPWLIIPISHLISLPVPTMSSVRRAWPPQKPLILPESIIQLPSVQLPTSQSASSIGFKHCISLPIYFHPLVH